MRAAIILAILALTLVINAVPPQALTMAELAGEAQANAMINRAYEVSITDVIIPGVPEIVGKKYAVDIGTSVPGIVIDGSGVALVPAYTVSAANLEAIAAESAKVYVTTDYAKIEYARKFGGIPPAEEITAYQDFFEREYGVAYIQARGKAVKVRLVSETVVLTQDGRTIATKIINKSGDNLIVSVVSTNLSGAAFSGIVFTNASVTTGDILYLLPPVKIKPGRVDSQLEVALVISNTTNRFELDRNISVGTIAINDRGQIVGLAELDGKSMKTSSALLVELSNAGAKPARESSIAQTYRLAKEAYELHQYDKALQGFEQVLNADPNNGASRYYLEQVVQVDGGQALLYRMKNIHPGILIAAFVGSALFLVVAYTKFVKKDQKKGKSRSGKNYSASDE